MRIILAALLALTLSAGAEEEIHHHEGTGPEIDRFYSSWNIPPQRLSSCCNRTDCALAESRVVDGHWEFRQLRGGDWVRVNRSLIENYRPDPHEAPDGRSHLCLTPAGIPICAVLGSGL